jgi:hypothetical protein
MNNMTRKGPKELKRRFRKKTESKNISRNKPLERAPAESKERQVHEKITDRRITGGIRMTRQEINEAYIRAQEQWLQLPGSIIRTPTDILLIQKTLRSKDSKDSLTTDNK